MIINFQQKIFLWLSVFLVIFWIVLLMFNIKSGIYNIVFGLFESLIPLIAGIVAIKKSLMWGTQNNIRNGIFFVGLGLFCWGMGGNVWSYYNIFKSVAVPYPSIADIFYLPSMLFTSMGVIYLCRASGADLRFKTPWKRFFVALAPVSVFVISYFIVVSVISKGNFIEPDESFFANFLNIAYPCIDFVGLTISIIISGLSFKYLLGRYKFGMYSLITGLLFMLISDSLFSYLFIHGKYYDGGISDFTFIIAIFFLIFGVLSFCGEKEGCMNRKIHIFEFLKYY